MWAPQTVVTVVRDITLLGAGTFGIIYQQVTGQLNITLLVLYAAMVGTPGAAHIVRLMAQTAATQQQSSQPPSSSSPGASAP